MNRKYLERNPIKNFWKNVVAVTITIMFLIPGASVFADGEGTLQNTIVSISPSTQDVENGETFFVDVYVEPGEPIVGVNVGSLSFDPTLIQAVQVTQGDLFPLPPDSFFMSGNIDNVAGTITLISLVTVPPTGVSDPGTFCTISFTAQQDDDISVLDLEGVEGADELGNPVSVIVNDGEVTAEGHSWYTTLNFNESSGKSDNVIFGEAADANDGPPADSYDMPKPPAPQSPYLRAWFDDDLPVPYDYLWYDYRSYPDTEKTWDLYVKCVSDSSEITNIVISWDADEFDGHEYDSVILYDSDNEIVCAEMTSENSYNFDVEDDSNNYFQIIATKTTNPPNIPSNPNPDNGATGVSVNADLSWIGGDPDEGDIVTYDIYFGTTSPPPKIVSKQSDDSFDPTLSYDTTYYWKIVSWDNHGASRSGLVWSFTTEGDPGGGGDPGGNGGDPGDPDAGNIPPIANASACEPYQGYVNSEILFDGTLSYDPDDNGYIKSWEWKFGDGTNGTGEITTHIYSNSGTYNVTLTVTDNEDTKDTDETTAVISFANNPPTAPTIDGVTSGDKDTEYTYTAVSTDIDGDNISYVFNWGDGTDTTSDFMASGTIYNANHNWSTNGIYVVAVHARDENNGMSDTTEIMVSIDMEVEIIDDIIQGYLLDGDNDGIYDMFHNSETGIETTIERQNDGSYLIDIDGDNNWDYIYDPVLGVSVYQNDDEEERTPGFEIIITISAIAVFLFWKRKKIVDKY